MSQSFFDDAALLVDEQWEGDQSSQSAFASSAIITINSTKPHDIVIYDGMFDDAAATHGVLNAQTEAVPSEPSTPIAPSTMCMSTTESSSFHSTVDDNGMKLFGETAGAPSSQNLSLSGELFGAAVHAVAAEMPMAMDENDYYDDDGLSADYDDDTDGDEDDEDLQLPLAHQQQQQHQQPQARVEQAAIAAAVEPAAPEKDAVDVAVEQEKEERPVRKHTQQLRGGGRLSSTTQAANRSIKGTNTKNKKNADAPPRRRRIVVDMDSRFEAIVAADVAYWIDRINPDMPTDEPKAHHVDALTVLRIKYPEYQDKFYPDFMTKAYNKHYKKLNRAIEEYRQRIGKSFVWPTCRAPRSKYDREYAKITAELQVAMFTYWKITARVTQQQLATKFNISCTEAFRQISLFKKYGYNLHNF